MDVLTFKESHLLGSCVDKTFDTEKVEGPSWFLLNKISRNNVVLSPIKLWQTFYIAAQHIKPRIDTLPLKLTDATFLVQENSILR